MIGVLQEKFTELSLHFVASSDFINKFSLKCVNVRIQLNCNEE